MFFFRKEGKKMKKIGVGILFCLILLLAACSNDDTSVGNSKGFKVGNISTSEFKDNEKYFLVIPLEWNGDNPVTIESVELIKENEKIVNLDNDRINYVFYGADANKKTGLYKREEIGDIEEIKGFKVDGKSTLVLEITLNNIIKDSNRGMKIKYTINGEEKEQLIESPMIQNLRTKK